MSHRENGMGQQGDQPGTDQEILGEEQAPSPEEEAPGAQEQNSRGSRGALLDEVTEQAMMGREEPGAQLPDEVSDQPEEQGAPIDPTMVQMDQETPDNVPADHLEKEVVPLTLEGLN